MKNIYSGIKNSLRTGAIIGAGLLTLVEGNTGCNSLNSLNYSNPEKAEIRLEQKLGRDIVHIDNIEFFGSDEVFWAYRIEFEDGSTKIIKDEDKLFEDINKLYKQKYSSDK